MAHLQRHYPAREGDEGDDVAWAQLLLGIVPANGVFDARTTERVRGFQRANKIYPNGALTRETLEALEERAEL